MYEITTCESHCSWAIKKLFQAKCMVAVQSFSACGMFLLGARQLSQTPQSRIFVEKSQTQPQFSLVARYLIVQLWDYPNIIAYILVSTWLASNITSFTVYFCPYIQHNFELSITCFHYYFGFLLFCAAKFSCPFRETKTINYSLKKPHYLWKCSKTLCKKLCRLKPVNFKLTWSVMIIIFPYLKLFSDSGSS